MLPQPLRGHPSGREAWGRLQLAGASRCVKPADTCTRRVLTQGRFLHRPQEFEFAGFWRVQYAAMHAQACTNRPVEGLLNVTRMLALRCPAGAAGKQPCSTGSRSYELPEIRLHTLLEPTAATWPQQAASQGAGRAE